MSSKQLSFLTYQEKAQICEKFEGCEWNCNSQVLWSGIPKLSAQQWADEHGMQTLTMAMGSLMTPSDPRCPRSRKSSDQWSTYIKGASVIFAQYISRRDVATVLIPPPPDRFHPSGHTSYQAVEELIFKGLTGKPAGRIEVVHPSVKGAENFHYQIWPKDEASTWIARFGMQGPRKHPWRAVKSKRNEGLINAIDTTLCLGTRSEIAPLNITTVAAAPFSLDNIGTIPISGLIFVNFYWT
jgi:hypothetical protein